jgi:type I restriction enzyme S subunit
VPSVETCVKTALQLAQWSLREISGLEHIPRKSIALNDWGSPESVDSDKLRFVSGDILFGKIRPYLHKVALAHFDGACSTDTIALRAKSPETKAFGLFTVFSSTFIDLATTASKGTKMPRADWHFLKRLEIRIPGQALLRTFEIAVEPMLAQIRVLLMGNCELSKMRDALLPRLISGKLRIDHLDIRMPPSMQAAAAA